MSAHAYDGDGAYVGVIPHSEGEDVDTPIERNRPEFQLVLLRGGPFDGQHRIILTDGLTLWPVEAAREGETP